MSDKPAKKARITSAQVIAMEAAVKEHAERNPIAAQLTSQLLNKCDEDRNELLALAFVSMAQLLNTFNKNYAETRKYDPTGNDGGTALQISLAGATGPDGPDIGKGQGGTGTDPNTIIGTILRPAFYNPTDRVHKHKGRS